MSIPSILTIFGISISLGIFISLLYVHLLKLLIKRRLSGMEKIRIDSLESIDELLKQSKKRPLNKNEISQIWSELMNYISTTNSRRTAEHYIKEIERILGRKGDTLLEKSETVLKEKFHTGGKESYSYIKS